MSTPTTVHVHVKNNRSGEDIFRITPARLADAMERHPDIAAGCTVTLDWDLDNFAEHMSTAEALVTWDLPTDDLANLAPSLRWIHIIGAGIEHLQPLDWLPPNVTLTNNRGVHSDKAGEYGLMAVLMLNNCVPELITAQRRHDYLERFTSTIRGRTLVVVGAGHMGSAVAEAVRPLGVRTIGIRRNPVPTVGFDDVRGSDELDATLPLADFVLLTTPLTEETHGLMDQRRLSLLPEGAGLINMGRAGVLDEAALIEALTSGRLGGAVLDVFDPEPVPTSSALWDTPNVVMTPHMSSDDAIWYTPKTLDLVFENVRRLQVGEPLINPVDPWLGY